MFVHILSNKPYQAQMLNHKTVPSDVVHTLLTEHGYKYNSVPGPIYHLEDGTKETNSLQACLYSGDVVVFDEVDGLKEVIPNGQFKKLYKKI